MTADSMQVQGVADRGQLPSLFSHRSAHDTPTVRIAFTFSIFNLSITNLDRNPRFEVCTSFRRCCYFDYITTAVWSHH